MASVWILENKPLIVMDLEDQLHMAGFNAVKILSSCADALGWLQNHSPNLGILDIELRDGACKAVAERLIDRDIPFVVHSGSFPKTKPRFS